MNGKKTYLIAVGAILVALGLFFKGDQSWQESLRLIIEALLAMGLRHGVAKMGQ